VEDYRGGAEAGLPKKPERSGVSQASVPSSDARACGDVAATETGNFSETRKIATARFAQEERAADRLFYEQGERFKEERAGRVMGRRVGGPRVGDEIGFVGLRRVGYWERKKKGVHARAKGEIVDRQG
jgi:hypothetical protein